MGTIIKLNTNPNSKDFNREKFEISIKKVFKFLIKSYPIKTVSIITNSRIKFVSEYVTI